MSNNGAILFNYIEIIRENEENDEFLTFNNEKYKYKKKIRNLTLKCITCKYQSFYINQGNVMEKKNTSGFHIYIYVYKIYTKSCTVFIVLTSV